VLKISDHLCFSNNNLVIEIGRREISLADILKLKSKPIQLHKAIVQPEFASKTVLVSDPWEYVEMWLKRNCKNNEALFYWQQAQEFFNASRLLPLTSSPLTSYYCFLNCVKTLLIVKNIGFIEQHGVSGYTIQNTFSLSGEMVKFKGAGILASLCTYLDEYPSQVAEYSLRSIFYNLPYIHRAYTLTFISAAELFIPISNALFMFDRVRKESWLVADIDKRYQNQHTINKLPNGYKQDTLNPNEWKIRRNKKFKWDLKKDGETVAMNNLKDYHRKVRKDFYYISGRTRLWYIKRKSNAQSIIQRSTLTLTFAAMHRLSELSRYQPLRLSKHLNNQYNWLLSEFIRFAPYQFIDEISSEITGLEFMIPGIATRE